MNSGTAPASGGPITGRSRGDTAAIAIAVALVALVGGIGVLWIATSLPYPLGTYCPFPSGPIFSLSSPNMESLYPTNASVGSSHWYNFSFAHCAPSNMTVDDLTFRVLNESRGVSVDGLTFTLGHFGGGVIATGNGSSDGWTSGGDDRVPVTGILTVSGSIPLGCDSLSAFSLGNAVSSGISFGPNPSTSCQ